MNKGLLSFSPVLDNPNLVPQSVYSAIKNGNWSCDRMDFLVAEIDPQFAGGKELCEEYHTTAVNLSRSVARAAK